jgi:hypothetical protein
MPAPLGLRVARHGRSKRSLRGYDLWLDDAGEASCSCPDFAKAGLGVRRDGGTPARGMPP